MSKASTQKIVFIGSGHLANYLADALRGKNDILQVYSKTIAHAKKLAKKSDCTFTTDLKKISASADLYIIAVKDDAIEEVCRKLKLKGKIVVHTSGSTSIDVLKNVSDKYGVMWPLYSFSDTQKNVKGIPFFIEASAKKTENKITRLVEELAGKPYYLNSEKRAIIHLGAVFVNNFSNHLFTVAESISKKANMPFDVFLPIAEETVENLKKQTPALSQTGPAARKDERILNKHLALLKEYPLYRDIYVLLTKSINKSLRGEKEF